MSVARQGEYSQVTDSFLLAGKRGYAAIHRVHWTENHQALGQFHDHHQLRPLRQRDKGCYGDYHGTNLAASNLADPNLAPQCAGEFRRHRTRRMQMLSPPSGRRSAVLKSSSATNHLTAAWHRPPDASGCTMLGLRSSRIRISEGVCIRFPVFGLTPQPETGKIWIVPPGRPQHGSGLHRARPALTKWSDKASDQDDRDKPSPSINYLIPIHCKPMSPTCKTFSLLTSRAVSLFPFRYFQPPFPSIRPGLRSARRGRTRRPKRSASSSCR